MIELIQNVYSIEGNYIWNHGSPTEFYRNYDGENKIELGRIMYAISQYIYWDDSIDFDPMIAIDDFIKSNQDSGDDFLHNPNHKNLSTYALACRIDRPKKIKFSNTYPMDYADIALEKRLSYREDSYPMDY